MLLERQSKDGRVGPSAQCRLKVRRHAEKTCYLMERVEDRMDGRSNGNFDKRNANCLEIRDGSEEGMHVPCVCAN